MSNVNSPAFASNGASSVAQKGERCKSELASKWCSPARSSTNTVKKSGVSSSAPALTSRTQNVQKIESSPKNAHHNPPLNPIQKGLNFIGNFILGDRQRYANPVRNKTDEMREQAREALEARQRANTPGTEDYKQKLAAEKNTQDEKKKAGGVAPTGSFENPGLKNIKEVTYTTQAGAQKKVSIGQGKTNGNWGIFTRNGAYPIAPQLVNKQHQTPDIAALKIWLANHDGRAFSGADYASSKDATKAHISKKNAGKDRFFTDEHKPWLGINVKPDGKTVVHAQVRLLRSETSHKAQIATATGVYNVPQEIAHDSALIKAWVERSYQSGRLQAPFRRAVTELPDVTKSVDAALQQIDWQTKDKDKEVKSLAEYSLDYAKTAVTGKSMRDVDPENAMFKHTRTELAALQDAIVSEKISGDEAQKRYAAIGEHYAQQWQSIAGEKSKDQQMLTGIATAGSAGIGGLVAMGTAWAPGLNIALGLATAQGLKALGTTIDRANGVNSKFAVNADSYPVLLYDSFTNRSAITQRRVNDVTIGAAQDLMSSAAAGIAKPLVSSAATRAGSTGKSVPWAVSKSIGKVTAASGVGNVGLTAASLENQPGLSRQEKKQLMKEAVIGEVVNVPLGMVFAGGGAKLFGKATGLGGVIARNAYDIGSDMLTPEVVNRLNGRETTWRDRAVWATASAVNLNEAFLHRTETLHGTRTAFTDTPAHELAIAIGSLLERPQDVPVSRTTQAPSTAPIDDTAIKSARAWRARAYDYAVSWIFCQTINSSAPDLSLEDMRKLAIQIADTNGDRANPNWSIDIATRALIDHVSTAMKGLALNPRHEKRLSNALASFSSHFAAGTALITESRYSQHLGAAQNDADLRNPKTAVGATGGRTNLPELPLPHRLYHGAAEMIFTPTDENAPSIPQLGWLRYIAQVVAQKSGDYDKGNWSKDYATLGLLDYLQRALGQRDLPQDQKDELSRQLKMRIQENLDHMQRNPDKRLADTSAPTNANASSLMPVPDGFENKIAVQPSGTSSSPTWDAGLARLSQALAMEIADKAPVDSVEDLNARVDAMISASTIIPPDAKITQKGKDYIALRVVESALDQLGFHRKDTRAKLGTLQELLERRIEQSQGELIAQRNG